MRLLRTPLQYQDESLLGYLIRLTETNGYDSPQWIIKNAQWNINLGKMGSRTFYRRSLRFDKFAELTGKQDDERNSFEEFSQNFNSDLFSSAYINFDYSKFCPLCLQEANYYRSCWDLFPVNVCPVHHLILIDFCPKCEQRIGWNRHRVSICSCGYDLKLFEGKQISKKDVGYCAMIWKELGQSNLRSKSKTFNPLNSLPLEQYLEFIFLLGDLTAEKYHRKKLRILENKLIFQYLSRAFAAFNDFPANINQLFFSIFNDESHHNDKVIQSLTDFCENENLFFFLPTLDKYLENPDSPDFSKNFFELRKDLLTFRETAEHLGLSEINLSRLLIKGLLPKQLPNLRCESYFHKNDIESFRTHLSKFISEQEMRKILKVDWELFSQLLQLEIISPTKDSIVSTLRLILYEKKQFDDLLSQIRQNIKPNNEIQDEIESHNVLTMLRRANENIGLFVQNILQNQVQPVRESLTSGLLRFTFSQNEIKDYLNLRQKKSAAAKKQKAEELKGKLKRLVELLKDAEHRELMSYPKRCKEMAQLEEKQSPTVEEIRMTAKKIFKKLKY